MAGASGREGVANGDGGSQAKVFAEEAGLAAGKLDLGCAGLRKRDAQSAAEPGLNGLDGGEVDDLGAVGAKEPAGREAGFEFGEGAGLEGGAVGQVEAGVAAVEFEEGDVGQRNEPAVVAFAQEDVVRAGGEGGGGHGSRRMGGGLGQGLGEVERDDGFKQVVDRAGAEGAEGKVVVGGDEDDAGVWERQVVQDVKTCAAGELDVEEDEVGVVVLDGGDGGAEVLGFGRDVEVRVGEEEAAEFGPGDGFVFDEEDFHVRGTHGGGSCKVAMMRPGAGWVCASRWSRAEGP